MTSNMKICSASSVLNKIHVKCVIKVFRHGVDRDANAWLDRVGQGVGRPHSHTLLVEVWTHTTFRAIALAYILY